MKIEGRAIKLGDNINTDFIISGRYKFSITDIKELSKHIMEDIDPNFASKIIPGKSIIVAGKNFGMGSSREQAPRVIKECGIIAVVAKSFARIFYRNGFNIGLPLIELDTQSIKENDVLEIDLDRGTLKDITQTEVCIIKPLPHFMQELLKEGGIVNYYKKYSRLPEV
ncbi:MAG: 3-isopropylmalate dehydratase small subunit [Candidatus Omnitrophica bacterium]|nr:3-isopropylmalate dehydratase small subunit [Candidatus Omnitrophota bacterium]